MEKLTVGSCFSGIGGLELGLEWTGGFETKWQIENDEYASRVLAKHWPNVKRYGDIQKVEQLEPVDIICGGFPCQDVSVANTGGTGLSGGRSGLWRELLRTICMVRPKFSIVENVPNLLNKGMGTVLGDLAGEGHDTEWDCLSSHGIGADHWRVRVFIIAYASSKRWHAPTVLSRAVEPCQIQHHERGSELGSYLAEHLAERGLSQTPELSEYLMGLPPGFTEIASGSNDSDVLATQLTQEDQKPSAA